MNARVLLVLLTVSCGAIVAAEKKPLTNADVIKMVKAELPESIILTAIQTSPKEFDSSVDALIELKKAGVPPMIMEAMLQSAGADTASPPAAPADIPALPPLPQAAAAPSGPELPALPPPTDAPAAAAPATNQPEAFVVDGNGERVPLVSTSFRIIETKAKGASIATLATETAVNEVANEALRTGTSRALAETGGRFGGTIANAASGVRSLSKRLFRTDEVTFTYVYALDGREALNTVPTAATKFVLNFPVLPDANPGDFEPALLKISVTPNDWRMLGAMKAKKSEFSEGAPRPITIIEDRVAAGLRRLGRGSYELTTKQPLEPGDYALVLRPVDAKKKFLLQDFEQEQREGAVLRLLWDFRVQPAP